MAALLIAMAILFSFMALIAFLIHINIHGVPEWLLPPNKRKPPAVLELPEGYKIFRSGEDRYQVRFGEKGKVVDLGDGEHKPEYLYDLDHYWLYSYEDAVKLAIKSERRYKIMEIVEVV